MNENALVLFDNKWWVLHEVKGEMAILWRDGKRALIPAKEIKDQIQLEKGEK